MNTCHQAGANILSAGADATVNVEAANGSQLTVEASYVVALREGEVAPKRAFDGR
jgi:hypothetical protein